jgi:pyrroloquinoline-quinone synthase
MNRTVLFAQVDARVAKYDLLCHPFYQAWSAGKLTRHDLKEYAQDYYHHVEAFPTYLHDLSVRLDDGELQQAVLANLDDEKGMQEPFGKATRAHSELWLDFAAAMGAPRDLKGHTPIPEVKELISFFYRVARAGTPEEALAAFYAYESQVPRVASEKVRGLREKYGADERACAYFTLHATADIYHSQVWRHHLGERLKSQPEAAETALDAAENAAKMLWYALDGIEARRIAKCCRVESDSDLGVLGNFTVLERGATDCHYKNAILKPIRSAGD